MLNMWKRAKHPLQGWASSLHPVMSFLLPCSPRPWSHPGFSSCWGHFLVTRCWAAPTIFPHSCYLGFCAAIKATISPTHPWRPENTAGFPG